MTIGGLQGQQAEHSLVDRPTSRSGDRTRPVNVVTEAGRVALEAERGRRAGWLALAIEAELTQEERELLARSATLMERLATRQGLPGAPGPDRP